LTETSHGGTCNNLERRSGVTSVYRWELNDPSDRKERGKEEHKASCDSLSHETWKREILPGAKRQIRRFQERTSIRGTEKEKERTRDEQKLEKGENKSYWSNNVLKIYRGKGREYTNEAVESRWIFEKKQGEERKRGEKSGSK